MFARSRSFLLDIETFQRFDVFGLLPKVGSSTTTLMADYRDPSSSASISEPSIPANFLNRTPASFHHPATGQRADVADPVPPCR